MILGKDHKEPDSGNTFRKLNEIAVMEDVPHILFQALVVQLGPARASAVLEIPRFPIPDNPPMRPGHAGDCRVTLGKDNILTRAVCSVACRVDPANTDGIVPEQERPGIIRTAKDNNRRSIAEDYADQSALHSE